MLNRSKSYDHDEKDAVIHNSVSKDYIYILNASTYPYWCLLKIIVFVKALVHELQTIKNVNFKTGPNLVRGRQEVEGWALSQRDGQAELRKSRII